MTVLDILSEYDGRILENFPIIKYSNLYKKVLNNFYLEFLISGEKQLFSPLYTPVRGTIQTDLRDFVRNNNPFLDSLKVFIINSLFVYSALIEQNAYYLTNPQSIMIARLIDRGERELEVKFYSHYEDELKGSYNDKIYIGRDIINLDRFERPNLGLKTYFVSLREQNIKLQERAREKLSELERYKKPYLNEIEYSINETADDSLERLELFPQSRICDIPTVKLIETVDEILYIMNLMTELREMVIEFEGVLRQDKEGGFAKYITKFLKDLRDGIRYLRKLSTQMHLRISNFPISKC